MEPRIQYAQTADGVSIAFWTMGEGMPLVSMTIIPFSHCQLEWQFPEIRAWCERLAEKRMLVRYDGRGSGLSDREVSDYSLDALVLDLEAVVERLGLERFSLLSAPTSGPVAVAYAVRNPERVSRLILWCTYAKAAEMSQSPQFRAMAHLLDVDWELYTETLSHMGMGWEEGAAAHRFAAVMRECVSQEGVRAAFDPILAFDVTDLLPQIKVPTLVLHRRQVRLVSLDSARALASRIPDARLTILEGITSAPYLGDTEAALEAIDEFLGEGEGAGARAEPPEAGAFRTVLFTDVEGSTALTQRLGDARARELLREHERMVREALKSHGGAEVKTMGDGFMASFSSATKALECAIVMQRAFEERNAAISAHPEPVEGRAEVIRVRIGLNAGEPIAEDDPDGRGDLFGTAVNEAARITAAAKGGQILVANVVRELAKGKDFQFADRGDVALKGFEEPVRLYEVRWREDR